MAETVRGNASGEDTPSGVLRAPTESDLEDGVLVEGDGEMFLMYCTQCRRVFRTNDLMFMHCGVWAFDVTLVGL